MSNEQQPKPFVVGHIDMGFNAEKVLELAQEFSEQQPMTAEQMAVALKHAEMFAGSPVGNTIRSLLAEVQRQQGEIERRDVTISVLQGNLDAQWRETERLQAENDQLRHQLHSLREYGDEEFRPRFKMDANGNLTRIENDDLKGDRTDG
ncbi:hypothetical protein [Paenibacillus sp. RUD330]|uniref:hypothetical protein n=1 Tax=Paenibacillus sp. RUD330 TaxID=2023772 RepID=UPI000B92D19C|nr:hypothetical protein [Paenibacillus sp. RUD330]ASS66238.1 hypothetical protein CIC07_08800 [Paenibacillus sp. RUD330]